MTFNEFVNKYLGKKIDWDGYYGGQCVDLFRQYVDDVLDVPQPKGVRGAKDFWYNYEIDQNLKNYYERIPNTTTFVPLNGDVVIWDKWSGNEFGHVAVFIEGDVNSFTSFDQNYPTLSKCTKTKHNYLNPKVLGVLRPKKQTPVVPCGKQIISYGDGEGNRHEYDWYVSEWWVEKQANKEYLAELEKVRKENEGLRSRNAELAGVVSERDKQVTHLTDLNNKLNKETGEWQTTKSELETDLADLVAQNKSLVDQVSELKEQQQLEISLLNLLKKWLNK